MARRGLCEDDAAIRRVVGDAMRLAGHEVVLAHDGGEALRRFVEAGSTARVAAPGGLVLRAVAPLVDNAARHARQRVVVEALDLPDRVELVIADDGHGVDPSVREDLFQPGVSAAGGAGLGLGIAQRVARSFGGEVDLDPAVPGGGARFRLRLPRR